MSFPPPRSWAPPATYRPRTIVYVLAAVSALVLLITVAVPIGIGVLLYRGDWPPTSEAAAGAPTAATGGANGAGDPYFPDYGSSGYDAASYSIAVDFDPQKQRLTGTTVVRARATQDLESFYLDLALPVTRVLVDDVEAEFEQQGFQDLEITPATPVRERQSFSVSVSYAGEPGELRREGVEDSPWRAGDDEWTVAGEPESSAWWYPANDHPSDPALVDVSVRVPTGYQAVSVGRLVSSDAGQETDHDTWHWRTSEPLPTYASFLAIGHYELKQGESGGRPFVYAASTRYSAEDRVRLFAALERTPALIAEIEAFAGPYPYSDIGGFVPATELWFAGLETATRPVYQASALLDDRFGEELLVHELAHMWFGDHVTLLQWNDIFTNEAFASWAYWEVVDRRGGKPADDELDDTYARTKDERGFWQVTMIDPGPTQLFGTVYVRGPMAVQALGNVLGDRAFGALVRTWAQGGGTRSLEDFMVTAQARTSTDLTPFFREWLFDPDAPEQTKANGFG
ncbi:M1 family metallopeptidase [Nocardioides sp.]|uniref:M1 family metallopeptidase n=1 Tax=Nocardioides sp. TaxID=35761 RepID=UPI002ED05006